MVLTVFAVENNVVDCSVTDESCQPSLYDDLTTGGRGWNCDLSEVPLARGADPTGPESGAGDHVGVQQVNIHTIGTPPTGAIAKLKLKHLLLVSRNSFQREPTPSSLYSRFSPVSTIT